MKKRSVKILSLVLALVMAFSLCPLQAFAAGGNQWGWGGSQGPEMPAQQLKATDKVTGVSVTVDAPEGALPEGTTLNLQSVNLAAVQNIVDNDANATGTVVAAEDITFMYEGTEIEPEKNVSVTLSSDVINNTANPTVLHLDCSAEEIESGSVSVEVMGSGTSFSSSDFSVYAVADGSGAGSFQYLTVEFYDADGSAINKQVIRMDQIADLEEPVHDPGVPSLTTTQSFEGWSTDPSIPEDEPGLSVADINAHIKATYGASSTNKTLSYYAKVYEVRYVVYHDQAGAVLMTQSYHKHTGNSTEPVKIEWAYVGFKGEQNFAGWIEEEYVDVMGDYPLYKDTLNTTEAPAGHVYKNGTTYDLSTTLELYPYLNTGHWLIFDTYKDQTPNDSTSTSYISPVFYEEGKNTAAPEKPTRTGYEFKGWYKDKNFTQQFIFGSPISEDTTVYAKWQAKNSTYHVVYWVQKVTDTPDTANDDKAYDFYDSRVATALTGTDAQLEAADTLFGDVNGTYGRLGYYFVLSENTDVNQTAKVKGDGSTVLNVYYDRKVITFKYYETDKTTLWTPSGGYVAAANGEYYYYTAQNSGYYLIGTGPNASYQPSNGDTTYYYDTYSDSGTYALPSYDNFTKYRASLSSYGGSHTYNSNSNTYYVFTDHQETRIWYVDGNNYPYRPLFYQFTEQYSTGYYHVGTGPTPEATGTHNLSGSAGSNTISGLYGAQLPSTMWPNSGSGYVWANDETISGTTKTYLYPLALTEFVPVQSEGAADTTEMKFYLSADSGTEMHIYYVGKDLNGDDYTVPLTDGVNTVSSGTNHWYPNETIHGYKVAKYKFERDSSWTACTEASEITLPTSSQVNSWGDLYVAFERNTHQFSFYSNNTVITPDSIPAGTDLTAVPYGTPLAAFQSAVPTNGPEGYYFDGWYADPAFDTEFDFDATMPDNNIRIYAKWTIERFRVVLDPTGGEAGVTASDITFPGNQATTFRVDYGELVQASSINNAQREGYTLLGWFLDKDYKIPFNFSNPVTDAIADMTYADAEDDERQGVDPWTLENGQPKPYSDVGRDNVRGKVTIYAHWRQDPDGVIGINVKYVATDKAGNTGKFSDDSTEWTDPRIYADQAQAFGQPASVPDNNNIQFLYWEILDKNGDVVGKAYPGQLWTVDIENAVVTDLTAQAVYVSYADFCQDEDAAPAEAQSVSQPQAEPQAEPVRATNTYKKVTTLTEGKKYLITYTTGSTAYIMGNTLNSNNYINAVSASVSSNTITGDYDQYLFGVDINSNGYYQFGNLNTIGYLGLNSQYGRGLSLTASSSYNTWQLTSNNYLQNTAVSTSSGYPIIQYNSGTFRGNDSSNNGYQVMTFYELQEPEVTGKTFDVTTELKVGSSYIIAIGDYAVGNQPLNSSTNDHFIKGVRGKANTSSFTVPTADVDAATWEIVSSNATGFIFKNKGNGTYLGMSSDGQCYLAATSEALAASWTYDNGTDLNNHVTESANASGSNYFYYLSFAGAFLDFTTATYTGQGVKLYTATTSYTVTFKDGRTNEVIKTEQVEEGKGATAPEAPDHTNEGYIFTGWDTDYSNVTANITVTAQYTSVSELKYTVTFRYMNSDGEWVESVVQNVQHGSTVTAPVDPSTCQPNGYTFNTWDKKLTNITSNLTINAVYKQEATKSYTITLRAMYGRANKNALTHITWFGNNDPDGLTSGTIVQRDIGVSINVGIEIPRPEAIVNGEYDHAEGGAKAEPTTVPLTYEDHVFLGWARLDADPDDAANVGTAHPELTEDDLYLKWNPNITVTIDGESYTGGYQFKSGNDWVAAQKVAADEMQPYHDLYAVWGKVFYVYHSSTGMVERRVITEKKVETVDGVETRVDNTVDLTALVPAGSLYGGYYKTYAGKAAATSASLFTGNDAVATATELNTPTIKEDTGAKCYNAEMLSKNATDTVVTWSEDQAYTNAPGTAIVPVAGTTYYIKEVPAALYLRHYTHYTYRLGTNAITSLYMISAIDDPNYNSIGAVITNTATGDIQAVKSLTIKAVGGSGSPTTTVTYYPSDIFNILNNGTKGAQTYLTYIRCEPPTDDAAIITVDNYWVTLDGVTVHGATPRSISNATSAETIGIVNNPTP